jgi:hypothetical protein
MGLVSHLGFLHGGLGGRFVASHVEGLGEVVPGFCSVGSGFGASVEKWDGIPRITFRRRR